jgi:hypothetical protein
VGNRNPEEIKKTMEAGANYLFLEKQENTLFLVLCGNGGGCMLCGDEGVSTYYIIRE